MIPFTMKAMMLRLWVGREMIQLITATLPVTAAAVMF